MRAGTRMLRTKMVETVIGTPIEDVRPASEGRAVPRLRPARSDPARQAPCPRANQRGRGRARAAAAAAGADLRPDAESPASRTTATGRTPARATAPSASRARFVGHARGGHMLVAHAAEFN